MCMSAVRWQDELVFKQSPGFVGEVVSSTEVRVSAAIKTNELAPAGIDGNTETNAFDFLCKQGCPKRELLYLLGMCENRGVTKASNMTGYDSAELRTKLRDIRECADSVSRMNGYSVPKGWGGTQFGQVLEISAVKV